MIDLIRRAHRGLDHLAPVADLAVRLWVAPVFFKAGLVKTRSWETTLLLFENEYQVPLLSPEAAAYLGTGAELVLPVLLALGLAGRFAAVALFLFNVVAVISYPALQGAGLEQHYVWGILLLVTAARGPGALSLDRLLHALAASWPRFAKLG
jgi:putative oxidoreductase